jgi:hypothetical protein
MLFLTFNKRGIPELACGTNLPTAGHLILPLYRFESTHDVLRGMVAPFDRKALWQGKNENNFRPYLITPFAFLSYAHRTEYLSFQR